MPKQVRQVSANRAGSRSNMNPLARLAIHTITTKPWQLEEAIQHYSQAGVAGISVWVEALADRDPHQVRKRLDDHGMTVPALVRGGFFCDPSAAERARRIEHNRSLIETAAILKADMLVLVVGATPGVPLSIQRLWVQDAIVELVPFAKQHGVKLAIEPLHPMYAGDRSCISTLAQARQICTAIDDPLVGVALDVYHVWWDDALESEIAALGQANRLFAFHLCDWRCPTRDMLNDRALMGDGCIDLVRLRRLVHDQGFDGWEEVEIFSNEHWAKDQTEFLQQIIERYLVLTSV